MKLSKEAHRAGAYRFASRFHAVALNMEEKPDPAIADILNVHRTIVSVWLRKWRQEGMEGSAIIPVFTEHTNDAFTSRNELYATLTSTHRSIRRNLPHVQEYLNPYQKLT